MMTINPYLTFEDNCEAAFDFYKSVFGGDFLVINRFSEMPDSPEFQITEADKNKIMHVTLPIGDGQVLMGSDTASGFGQSLTVGNNFSISINPGTVEAADRIFNGLAEGGKITMPINKTFWNAYFGTLTDQFGIQWMINCDLPT